MNKRILSLVLALVMVLGTFAVVSAAEEVKVPEYTTQQQKIQWLVDNKIVEGHKINEEGKTDLDLEGTLTREQATKLIVHTVGKYDLAEVLKGVMKPFPDVDLERWSNGVISVARTEKNAKSGQPIVIGYEDGTFKPEQKLTYAELATMLVRIVKDDLSNKMVENAVWATSWMRWAEELGILDGVKVVNSDAPVSRADAFEMIFNTMYKLGEYKGNKAEFGINMGIVSKLQAGKLEINQDKEKTYNFTYNTKIVNNVTGAELAANAVVPGSLVRYIVDADNNLEQILVMSTPDFRSINGRDYSGYHTTNNSRVFGVGDGVFGAVGGKLHLDTHYKPDTDVIKVTKNYNANDFDGNVKVTSKTKVFVADPARNALKEFKSIEEALRVFNKRTEYKGFAIYDTFKDYRGNKLYEATVLVFTETDKNNFSTNTYRVRYDVNSRYFAGLEEANNGKIVSIDFAGVNFLPGSYNTHNMDVVSFGNPRGNADDAYAKTIIDYSEDNVYQVVSIADRYITVKTEAKYNREAKIGMPTSTKVFNDGKALRVGDHIQISREATADNVKVISVVDKALKGNINLGTETDLGIVRAYISKVSKSTVHGGYDVVTVYDVDSTGYKYNYRTLLVPTEEITSEDEGKFYEFRVANNYYWANGVPVAVEWKEVANTALEAINAYRNSTKENRARLYEAALVAINKVENDTDRATLLKTLEEVKKELEAEKVEPKLTVEKTEATNKLTTQKTFGDLKATLIVKLNGKTLDSKDYGFVGKSHKDLLPEGELTLTVKENKTGATAELKVKIAK